jgi:hypothetical protein
MDQKTIKSFLKALNDVMKANGEWYDKQKAIIAEASPDDKTNLEEVATWFESVD